MSVDLAMPTFRGAQSATAEAAQPGLIDSFGRVATDLRVSLTDRCNLRCTYCMPAEGLDWMPSQRLLTDEEVLRLIQVAVGQGVTTVRFTGGEPLLRRGLEQIIAGTAALRTLAGEPVETALTTNGLGLDKRADALVRAGLNRINVSLDTLRADRFERITRRDRLPDVLAGLAAARSAGLTPVKVNAVLTRGVNDDEPAELLEWALAEGYELRFIETMPLEAQGTWQREEMITAEQILEALRVRYTLDPEPGRGSAPAERFTVSDADGRRFGRVGVIAAVTKPFCGNCDRTRLTADGQVRNCLFANSETDLRGLLRSGADDDALAAAWRLNAAAKQAGHGIGTAEYHRASRSMSAIGG